MRRTAKERETEDLAEKVRERISYDPETGLLSRLQNTNRWKKGPIQNKPVSRQSGCSYYDVYVDGGIHRAHRIAWLLHYDEWPDGTIDHEDGNGLDNRITNLRCVTQEANSKNQRVPKNNTSGHIGVSWSKSHKKWQVKIKSNYKNIHIGFFSDIEHAVKYRKEAEVKYGFHANHGRK